MKTNRNLDHSSELATGETWELVVNRFDVYLIELDPAIAVKLKNKTLCIVSPNEMNCLKTVLIAPMTTKGFMRPQELSFSFKIKPSYFARSITVSPTSPDSLKNWE